MANDTFVLKFKVTSPPTSKTRVARFIVFWQRPTCYTFLRFTSGITLANLLMSIITGSSVFNMSALDKLGSWVQAW